jgi:hypothetical protein
VVFLLYLTATVVLFAFGPWHWPVRDPGLLYGFLGACHLALLAGYLGAAFTTPRGYGRRLAVRGVLTLSILLNLALALPTVAARTGRFVPDVAAGLTNPGLAYSGSLEAREGGGAYIAVEYVRIVLAPLLAMAVPLVVYYSTRLRGDQRALGVAVIVAIVMTFIAMGTNKAIADLILVIPWLVVASHFGGYRRLGLKHVAVAGAGLLCAAGLFFAFFTAGQLTRHGSGASLGYFPATDDWADQKHPLVAWLPEEPRAGANALILYVTHGYYGLYLSMQEPFVPMFGIGNSMALTRNVARVLDRPELVDEPYPMRVRHRGWDPLGLWSSAYPWFASDVSFPGVVVLMFLLGRLLALTWLDTLRGANPYAIALFSLVVIMVSYLPANNQVLQGPESLVAFFALLVIWAVTRRPARAALPLPAHGGPTPSVVSRAIGA